MSLDMFINFVYGKVQLRGWVHALRGKVQLRWGLVRLRRSRLGLFVLYVAYIVVRG